MATPSEVLASALLERARRRRALEAVRGSALVARLRAVVEVLRRDGIVVDAWLIGSLAWGDFGERSDVDVVVQGVCATQLAPLAHRVADALGVSVDLLRLEDLSDTFRRRVLREGLRLHES